MTNMEDVVMAAKVRLLQFKNPNVCKEQLSSMPWTLLGVAVSVSSSVGTSAGF